MSRIYEALRRADLERKAGHEPELNPMDEPLKTMEFVGPASVLGDIMIGNIAKHVWTPSATAIPCLLERGIAVEQFRGLRSQLSLARLDNPIKTVLISSGMASEGKSFVALNLAVSLARDSVNRVLLIDGDMRAPTLHNLLGALKKPGLSEYLAGTIDLVDILQQYEDKKIDGHTVAGPLSNLTFISSGASSDNSSELVNNVRMKHLIASLSQHFDWIVIDSPPALVVADAVDLARITDAVLLVAREARTPFEVLQRAQAAFRQARLLGVVFNAAKLVNRDKYYYYSSYGKTDTGTRRNQTREKRSKE